MSNRVRQNLLERASNISELYSLPKPLQFISKKSNYYYWSLIFNRVLGIRCNKVASLRDQQIGHLKACLNMLQIVLEIPVSHIQADRLLEQDLGTIRNLLEIIEPLVASRLALEDLNVPADAEHIDRHPHQGAEAGPVVNEAPRPQVRAAVSRSKGLELAEKLDKALKSQILAVKIEKTLKIYLGDFSMDKEQQQNLQVRASRESIVRTRSIQPSGRTTFDCTGKCTKTSTNSISILSVDLLHLFPEIANEGEIIGRIQRQEKQMLMSDDQIQQWAAEKNDLHLTRVLEETINRQRQQTQPAPPNQQQQQQRFNILSSQKETRQQLVILQKEIDVFYQQSFSTYLSARSSMEKTILHEFKKIDSRQPLQINEVRKYLATHNGVDTNKLRVLLDNFDEM